MHLVLKPSGGEHLQLYIDVIKGQQDELLFLFRHLNLKIQRLSRQSIRSPRLQDIRRTSQPPIPAVAGRT